MRWMGSFFAAVVLAFPSAATAEPGADSPVRSGPGSVARPAWSISGRLEPGVAAPISSAQSNQFGVGGGVAAKVAFGVLPMLDVQASGSWMAFPTKDEADRTITKSAVTIATAGGGVRLQRPRSEGGVSPWIDGELAYVRTGSLDRFGAGAAGGVSFLLRGGVWAGPFVRYVQVVNPGRQGFVDDDARVLLAGLGVDLTVGVGSSRPEPAPFASPPPPRDSDGDGSIDADDKCPTVPGPIDNGGCPWIDADGDGVLDHLDKCPREPGPKENDGCRWPDGDGDGIADKDDKCPLHPGPAALGGCPDSDGDGIADADDQCPKVAGDAETKGCPRYKQIVVTQSKIELGEKIFFAFDQATILPKSFGLLDEVGRALRDAPQMRVRIEGHTDARGNTPHNLALSQARANAVREYMVDHGVGADRLQSVGYGSGQPLDSNATTAGREQNRRVEFVILRP
jgi:outer membrane protein OmpA-like peptidoglycan-associated protein